MPTVTKHAAGAPCWFDLMTPDLEKARAFYGALFGWSFEVGPPETGHYAMGMLGGRPAAGLGKLPPGAPFPSTWSVYFATDDLDATCANLREQGGQVVMGPMDVMAEGRLAFCADPTGAHFGVWQPTKHVGAQVKEEPGAMVWQEVNTRDGARACAFYAKVLGLEPRKLEGAGIEYWTLQRSDEAKAGILQMDARFPEQVPAHWMAYFAVADTDRAVERVKELGGQMRVPPFDSAYGRIAVVADPGGATFSLVRPSEAAQP